ncbi:MAG: hypothetical protein AAF766_16685 [Cyanobacteria bacterium P01_D01_bin.14]
MFIVELLDFAGPQSVFEVEDDGTATEVWNNSALPSGFDLFAAFEIAAGPNGELAITSNGGDASEDNVFRLLDLNSNGDYLNSGETIAYAARSLNGLFPKRPRALAYRTPLEAPTAVPEAA